VIPSPTRIPVHFPCTR